MNKRRTRVKSAMNSKLMVKHRKMTEDEVSAQVRKNRIEYLIKHNLIQEQACRVYISERGYRKT